jgi:hypothetical protein
MDPKKRPDNFQASVPVACDPHFNFLVSMAY